MARHRNIRSMNYDEGSAVYSKCFIQMLKVLYNPEYDGYDDIYGHSVEDDYSASPSVRKWCACLPFIVN